MTNKRLRRIKKAHGLKEKDLKQSHLFLDSIFENIPNMVFVKDAKNLRFIRFNKAGQKLLGYSLKDLIGKNDYDFFTKEEANFFTQKDRRVLDEGKMLDIPEESIHTKHKGIRLLHTKKIPVWDEEGQPRYLLGISEDITERKKLEKEVLDISEREQRRIGQDLHDGLGQHLTGIALLTKGLAQKLEAKNMPEGKQAAHLAQMVNHAIAQTKDLARLLCPVELEIHGLVPALQELASSTKKMLPINCQFRCSTTGLLVDKLVSMHLYRIAQEGLDNAVKHSKATGISIELIKTKKSLQLKIRDNGTGFIKKNRSEHGMGMRLMKHRAAMIGAQLSFNKNKPSGTLIKCNLFMDKNNALKK